MIMYIAGGIAVAIIVIGIIMLALYRIVSPSEAHVVVGPTKKMVCSPDEKIQKNGGAWYFMVPLIRTVRILSTLIQEVKFEQETIEKGQARYSVESSTKYRITDVGKASETYMNDSELKKMLEEIIKSAVRAITVNYDVETVRAMKLQIEADIRKEITDDLSGWGLELVNFQLVNFKDTEESTIITNISRRREVEVETDTREQNAEKLKQAKIKEADADEKSKEREIQRDKKIGEYQQQKEQAVRVEEKKAKEAEYDVIQVSTIRKQKIEKERQVVEAEQKKEVAKIDADQRVEVEEINKKQKELEGSGDRLRKEEQAKGEAAKLKENGLAEATAIEAKYLAEAKGKDELQKALNRFGPAAIEALVAEKVVDKDKAVGIAAAEALAKGEVKAFLGGSASDKDGFNFGKAMEALVMSSSSTSDSFLNRLGKPNDLGGNGIPVNTTKDKETDSKPKDKETNSKPRKKDGNKILDIQSL